MVSMRNFTRGFREEALRARDITSQAFPLDKRNSRYVSPSRLEETRDGWRFFTLTKIPGEKARRHVVNLKLPRGYQGTLNACPEVRIDCDCQRYLFVWNYALLQKNAAIRDRTNGEPPEVTNPSEIPGCCVAGSSWIHTEFGSTRLRDIQVGDRVRTLSGLRCVTEKVDQGLRDVLAINMESGRRLRTTPDHRILTASSRGLCWLRADQLDDDCWLIGSHHDTRRNWPTLPTEVPPLGSSSGIAPQKIPNRLTPEVAEFLGLFVAEGSGSARGASLSQYEPITRARIVQLSRKLFDRPSAEPLRLGRQVSYLLQSWGIRFGSYEVRVPDVILQASNDVVIAFLKGYYAGDGWFSRSGKFSTAGTASIGLRDDLMYLLARIGIHARADVWHNSGINGIVLHAIRTSSIRETSLAAQLFLPERCNVAIRGSSHSKYDSGSTYDRVPKDAVNTVLLNGIIRREGSKRGSTDLVPVRDLVEAFPKLGVWSKLKLANRIRYITRQSATAQVNGSGKPLHYSTMQDALEVTLAARIKQKYKRYRLHGSSAIHRKQITYLLDGLPTSEAESVREDLQIFLRNDVFFERISRVAPTQPVRVYDIGVEGSPHFFADGICVHNCKHALVAIGTLVKLNPRWPNRAVTNSSSPGYGTKVTLNDLQTILRKIRRR